MKFEQIDNFHQRAKVYGGWIVKAFENVTHETDHEGMASGWDFRVAMCFVPDQDHEWAIEIEKGKVVNQDVISKKDCLHKNWDALNQPACPDCGEDIPF
jgi:hypothetical protein